MSKMAAIFCQCLILLSFIVMANLVQAQQVNVLPSKYILVQEDHVILQCVSFGLQPDPYNVVAFTSHGKVIYNSSNTKQLAPDVSVINQTTISYRNVSNGVSDIGCRINNTVSQMTTTIPHVNYVSLSHSPSKFQLNTNFTAKCDFSISPNVSSLVISFSLNQTEIARFTTVSFQSPTFSIPNMVSGLAVQQGKEAFSIVANATNSSAEGKYTCSVQVSFSSASVTVTSNEWNTSGCQAIIPSVLLLTLAAILALFW